MEIELVYADGDDFHKLEMIMVGTDLRMFIDREEKQIVGRIWVGESSVLDRESEEREDTEASPDYTGPDGRDGGRDRGI